MYAEQFKWQVRSGAGQGTSSTETSVSMAGLHWRKEREGGREDSWFWQKTRTKKAECLTSTYSASQVLIWDRGRLRSPAHSIVLNQQVLPEPWRAFTMQQAMMEESQLKFNCAILQWTILSYAWHCGSVQGNKHSSSSAYAASTAGNHSQSQTAHSWAAQMSHARLGAAEQPGPPSQVETAPCGSTGETPSRSSALCPGWFCHIFQQALQLCSYQGAWTVFKNLVWTIVQKHLKFRAEKLPNSTASKTHWLTLRPI